MAKPKDCAHCQKTATIHLTQIIDGKITKLDFCEDCPHQKEVSDPEAFSLAQILATHGSGEVGAKLLNTACAHCGMTLNAFKKSGRLGCAHCYEQFHDVVMQMLPQMQSGSEHTGKRPAAMLERMAHERRLTQLQGDLQEAIRTEAYEEAARLRDELNRWSAQMLADGTADTAANADAAANAQETAAEHSTPPADNDEGDAAPPEPK